MPITALDPATALIVIDLQKGITAMAGSAAAPVIAKSAQLAAAFRDKNLPVVLVNVVPEAGRRTEQMRTLPVLPPDWADLVPELKAAPSDHRVTKHWWGAFGGTGLEGWLRARGVTQVVIVGISTSVGVDTTARQAFAAGFNIAIATDAVADLDAEAHAGCLKRIFPRLGETGTADDILEHLARA
jgi:nicotinamidase-related amidase